MLHHWKGEVKRAQIPMTGLVYMSAEEGDLGKLMAEVLSAVY